LDDPAAVVRRLTPVLELVGTITRSRLRLWQTENGSLRLACGDDPGWVPERPTSEGQIPTPVGPSWFVPVPENEGLWLEIHGEGTRATGTPRAALAAPLLERMLSTERDATRLWEELTVRYAEIDLLYAISEILGQTVRLEEAARTILRQVARVVGRARASIMVYDDQANLLRVVASQGFDKTQAPALSPDDPVSIAARVFRDQRVVAGEASPSAGRKSTRHPGYRGNAFLSVPINYAAPGAPARCIGVINLTDSLDSDRFTPRDRKLVTAVANQIGAAIENARLAAREREQQRLEDELALAHDLQLRLMPEPSVLKGAANVAVRCEPVASVGGDFYTFLRLPDGTHRRHARRRLIARHVGRADDGAGALGRRHSHRVGRRSRRDAAPLAREPAHQAFRDGDVRDGILRRARQGGGNADVCELGPSSCVPGRRGRHRGATRGHGHAPRSRHLGTDRANHCAVGRAERPALPLHRWTRRCGQRQG
jgi:hypothetical protein